MKKSADNLNKGFYRAILIFCGIAFSLFFMAVAMKRMEWENVFNVMSNIQLYPWIFISLIFYLTGHLVRGIRTRLLVSRDTKLSVITASNIVVVGYGVNNLLPGRLGEFARAGMLSERTGIPFIQSLAVVIIERLLDGLVILFFLIISALFLSTALSLKDTIWITSMIFGSVSFFIIFIVIAPNRFIAVISKIMVAVNQRWHDPALKMAASIANGVAYLRKPESALTVFGITGLIWLCDAMLFMFLLPAFNLPTNIWYAIFAMSVTNIGLLIPSGPGHIIAFRLFCVQAMMLLGITETLALCYAMMVLVTIYVPLTLWGGAVILWYGIALGKTVSLTKKAKTVSGDLMQAAVQASVLGSTSLAEKNVTASVFYLKLTEAALPLDTLNLKEPQKVVSDVANFIYSEVQNLPRKFQVLFAIAMFGFNLLIFLRYFRLFSLLEKSTRTDIFNGWAYGKIAITRKLFKLVRSTALLAFYEHPKVLEALENK